MLVKGDAIASELNALAREMAFCGELRYRGNTKIFGEAEPAEYLYQIVKGAVRTYKLLSDGRRQIRAFHVPGDIFGVETGEVHRFTAEAIIDTTVRLANRGRSGADHDALETNKLLKLVTLNLQHAENQMMLLGRKNSLEKVAAFLIEMDGRLTTTGALTLPMGRRDIADYLGLTLETVSRELSRLKSLGILNFKGKKTQQRKIVLLDRSRLAELDP
jgi:CRP/FNR family transcriptional regulator, nitrogen fixation regulation protein